MLLHTSTGCPKKFASGQPVNLIHDKKFIPIQYRLFFLVVFSSPSRWTNLAVFQTMLKLLLRSQLKITINFITTEGKNQTLVAAIPYCGEYPGPRFEDKFRSANQMGGVSKAGEIKWLPVNL